MIKMIGNGGAFNRVYLYMVQVLNAILIRGD
jgi:hypothetical protein